MESSSVFDEMFFVILYYQFLFFTLEFQIPSLSGFNVMESKCRQDQAAVWCSCDGYRFCWAGIWVLVDGQAGPCLGGAWVGAQCWLGGRGRGLFCVLK